MNRERLQELCVQIDGLPATLDEARRAETQARLQRDDAKENLDLATTNALISAGDETGGKNAEERKLKSDAYLASHAEVMAAKAAFNATEAALVNAQCDTRHAEDVFAATRAELRAIGSFLEYLAGEPRRTNGK